MVFVQCAIHTNGVYSVRYSYKWCLFNIPFLRQRFLTGILPLVVASHFHFTPWPSMKELCHAFSSRPLTCSFVPLLLLDEVFFYQAWVDCSSRSSCLESFPPSVPYDDVPGVKFFQLSICVHRRLLFNVCSLPFVWCWRVEGQAVCGDYRGSILWNLPGNSCQHLVTFEPCANLCQCVAIFWELLVGTSLLRRHSLLCLSHGCVSPVCFGHCYGEILQ